MIDPEHSWMWTTYLSAELIIHLFLSTLTPPESCFNNCTAEEKRVQQIIWPGFGMQCAMCLWDFGRDKDALRVSMGYGKILLDPSKMTSVATYFHELGARAWQTGFLAALVNLMSIKLWPRLKNGAEMFRFFVFEFGLTDTSLAKFGVIIWCLFLKEDKSRAISIYPFLSKKKYIYIYTKRRILLSVITKESLWQKVNKANNFNLCGCSLSVLNCCCV